MFIVNVHGVENIQYPKLGRSSCKLN